MRPHREAPEAGAPDGLVVVRQDDLVRRVVQQVKLGLLLLDVLLDVMLAVVETAKRVDRLLVLGPHLDVVLLRAPRMAGGPHGGRAAASDRAAHLAAASAHGAVAARGAVEVQSSLC